jgi:hypothetical protein
MATTELQAESASDKPVALQDHTFVPAKWLASFEALGGCFTVTPDSHTMLGWFCWGHSDEDQAQARAMGNALTKDQRAALTAYLLRTDENFTPEAWLAEFIAAGGSAQTISGKPTLGYPEAHHARLANMRARLNPEQAMALRAYLCRLLGIEVAQ